MIKLVGLDEDKIKVIRFKKSYNLVVLYNYNCIELFLCFGMYFSSLIKK